MAKKFLLDSRSSPVLLTLLGISCHSRDYLLIYHLNNKLEFGFMKMEDFQGHSFFYFRDHNEFNAYFLLGNRGENSLLLPELKQADYLFMIEGPLKKAQKDHLINAIRSTQGVQTAFDVSFETLKNYEVMLSDLELHYLKISTENIRKYSPSKTKET